MKKNLIGLGLFIFFVSSLYGQNKLNMEFGIGPNFSSAILKYYEYKNTAVARTFTIYGRPGVTARLVTKYSLIKRMLIKTNISYNLLNQKYINTNQSTSPLPSYKEFITKTRSNTLGVSLGIEYFLFDSLSISGFLTFNKNFKRRSDIDVHLIEVWDPNFRETFEIIEDTKNEQCASIEISYYHKKFSFNPGFEYTFTERRFYPTENLVNRVKYYLLVGYLLY